MTAGSFAPGRRALGPEEGGLDLLLIETRVADDLGLEELDLVPILVEMADLLGLPGARRRPRAPGPGSRIRRRKPVRSSPWRRSRPGATASTRIFRPSRRSSRRRTRCRIPWMPAAKNLPASSQTNEPDGPVDRTGGEVPGLAAAERLDDDVVRVGSVARGSDIGEQLPVRAKP